mmetsp:Transcript_2960/g.6422  ORF Transcript_2960/g.6422 Transcript_2960/m.6422 type:complete len:211 (-) Transcript_2960:81-713(-)
MQAKRGFSKPTSTATMEKLIVLALCASSGDEMVRFALASRLKMYTSFCFSAAPIMTARPLGSAARNWPGTMRRQPLLPKVSRWTRSNWFFSLLNSSTLIRPESDPSTRKSLFAPGKRKETIERTRPKHSMLQIDWTFPLASGRSSSMTLPWETTTSCILGAEKFPRAVHVIADDRCRVKAYKNMLGKRPMRCRNCETRQRAAVETLRTLK